MRTMYDSVDATAIPTNAAMVGGYVDGLYVWPQSWWNRFPHAVKVRIAVFASTNDGHVLDVEQGNATPQQAPGWVAMRRRSGVDPTVYCSESLWPTLQAAFRSAGIGYPHWWIANYNDVKTVMNGAVAHQYADDTMVGAHYDMSAVVDYWPGVDPKPTPPSPLFTRRIDPMFIAHVNGNPAMYLVYSDGTAKHVQDQVTLDGLVAVLGNPVPMSQRDFAALLKVS